MVVAILAGIPAWLALSPKPEPGRKCTYVGRVVDQNDQKKKINEAQVSLDYKSESYVQHTNSEGIYRFVIPCVGDSLRADVRVEADGYEFYSREVKLLEKIEPIRLKPMNRTDVAPRTQTSTTNTPTPSITSDSSISNHKPTQKTITLFQQDFEGTLPPGNYISNDIRSTTGRTGRGLQVSYLDKAEVRGARAFQLPEDFKAGKTYQASVWCKANRGARCKIFFGDDLQNGTRTYENEVNNSLEGNGDWQKLTTPPIKMSHDEQMSVYIYSEILGTSATYDDILVEEVVNP
jgi:hypothetical protein